MENGGYECHFQCVSGSEATKHRSQSPGTERVLRVPAITPHPLKCESTSSVAGKGGGGAGRSANAHIRARLPLPNAAQTLAGRPMINLHIFSYYSVFFQKERIPETDE